MKGIIGVLCLFSSLSALPAGAFGAVTVFDEVCVTGQRVMLKAETRKKFFIEGGRMVEFFINGKSTGAVLSGGDGMAYREFSPKRAGLHEVRAVSSGSADEGLVLSLAGGSGLVFIDVAGSLFENDFSKQPKEGGLKAVREIIKRRPVVYLLSGMSLRLQSEATTMAFIKRWLKVNDFPPAPLLSWGDGRVFNDIEEKGLKVRAVIGSPAVVESARGFKARTFSFEEAEGAVEVEDWSAIEKGL